VAAARGHEVEHAQDLRAVAHHLAVAGLTPAQDAVAVDDEGGAVRHVPLFVQDAIRADRRTVDVAEQRERKTVRSNERFVAERCIATDRDYGRPAGGDLRGDLTQVTQLGASDATEVVAVKDEDDVGAPAKLRERHRLAAGGRETEGGRGLAEPKRRHRGQSTPNCPATSAAT
jgi:hypothetical protein